MDKTAHIPVLLEESLEKLNLKKGDTVVDATLGGGGHSREILKTIGDKGKLIAIDRDKKAIEKFAEFSICLPDGQISKVKNNYFVNSNFANLENILKALKIKSVDAVLADLGISSDQLEDAERGFSFREDAKLDMRMSSHANPRIDVNQQIANDEDSEITAEKIVNNYSEKDLGRIFRDYGEERFAGRIAKRIIETRKSKKIKTTRELIDVIAKAIPGKYRRGKRHFATKTFQALRIETNGELESLKNFLPQAIDALKTGGRLAVIAFHSGEDRIVKEIFRENARGCVCPQEFPICRCGCEPKIKIITKKPIIPDFKEVKKNPRSRSAKLRVAEKI